MGAQRKRADRVVALEEALLSGTFARYALYRLGAFGLARTIAIVTHVVELVWLYEWFSARSFVASLALQNVTLIIDALWWGALETMRRRVRALGPTSESSAVVATWMKMAVIGAVVVLAGTGLAAFGAGGLLGAPSPILTCYALLCGARLAADLVLRTYYSGVYAHRRVHRPLYSLFLGPAVLLTTSAVLWPIASGWSFPIALLASATVVRYLQYRFARAAYRRHAVYAPSWRAMRALRSWTRALASRDLRSRASTLGRACVSALANALTRIGSVVLLAALVPRLADERREFAADPFAFALHLAAPAILVCAQWTFVFYHDERRLDGGINAAIARKLSFNLRATGAVVACICWLVTLAIASPFVSFKTTWPLLLALLPSLLGLSWWSAAALRGFARGDFVRQAASALAMLAALSFAVTFDDEGTLWLLGLAAGPWVALAIDGVFVQFRGRHFGAVSVSEFREIVTHARGALMCFRAEVPSHSHAFADAVRERLGERGLVTRMGARVVWVEWVASSREEWLRFGAGLIARLDRVGPCRGSDLRIAAWLPETRSIELADMARAHAELFPNGIVLRLDRRPPASYMALDRAVRQEIWREGLRRLFARRPASAYEVTAHAPRGEIEALFAVKRPVEPARLQAWRAYVAPHVEQRSGSPPERPDEPT